MQQKQISSDRLTPLSANYPWLVAHKDDDGDQIFYNVYDPMFSYRCRIPELIGKHIQGCFHGWVILSNHQQTYWSLWNPAPTSTLIHLPCLTLKDIENPNFPLQCCLTSPPDVPGSILLLARPDKPNFVFCRLDSKRKRLRWTEMSYDEQLSSIIGDYNDDILYHIICCNGKVYAMVVTAIDRVIEIRIVVKGEEVMISLLPFVNFPDPPKPSSRAIHSYTSLIESSLGLLAIFIGIVDLPKNRPVDVYLYKLDTTSMVWEEIDDLKETIYVDMISSFSSIVCCPAKGGYVHLIRESGKVVYSYDVKDKTISLSFMDCLDFTPTHIAVWPILEPEFRLQAHEIHGAAANEVQELQKIEANVLNLPFRVFEMIFEFCVGVEYYLNFRATCKAVSKPDELKEDETVVVRLAGANEVQELQKIEFADILNLPFNILELISDFCIGVEYLNFRAACKRCHLAAPVINMKAQRRLQTYSLVSPWLMMFDIHEGIITFTDPMFGNKYFIKAPSKSPEIVTDSRIACSRYGWLLLLIGDSGVAFFNPFTSEIRHLPARRSYSESFCFSAPPTSPDCTVVAFSCWYVCLHFVAGEPIWHMALDFEETGPFSFVSPTFCGRDVYVLRDEGKVGVFRKIGNDDYTLEVVVDRVPTSRSKTKYFLAKCDQHLLLVMMGEFGEAIEVFRLTEKLEWEKMNSLGRHVIYICYATSASTCLCMDAKTPEMENKIYFPRLHSKNGKMVFYSLETRKFHTFDGRNIVQETGLEDFCGTKQRIYDHAWIEPTWC